MRVFNRLLAFVVALALLGTCVIVIVEVIAARSNAAPVIVHWHSMLHWGQRNTWKATSVELAAAITAVAGLLLLIPQLIPRKPSRLSLKGGRSSARDQTEPADTIPPASLSRHTDAALTRRGLAVTVRNAVEGVEGITRSRVKVGHRRIRITAQSATIDDSTAGDLEPQVTDAAQKHLDALGVQPPHRIRVAVSTRRSGVK